MANPEHVEILKQGVDTWNQWRKENRRVFPNLVGADLGGVDLRGVDLRGVYLSGADLRGTDFGRADLGGADLRWADLGGGNLNETYLIEADFSGADLADTVFTNSRMEYTTLGDVDLSAAIGLEEVRHHGPSTIGIDTIFKSKGKIPEAFLRGAGVPDIMIEYMGSLTGKAFEYYSGFISYFSKDESFVDRLYSDLQNNSVRVWYAPVDLKIGDKLMNTLDEVIRIRDKLMIVLSENSINSNRVEREVEIALTDELESGRVILFPIRIDEAVMETDKDWVKRIRQTRHIGDFSQWKDHDSYQKAFDRLLKSLKDENLD